MQKPDRKFRSWCFTLNNPTEEEIENLVVWGEQNKEDCYLVAHGEVGDNGTPHLQGYVRFKNARYLGGCRLFINRAHWESMRGTEQEAVDYCLKSLEKNEEPDIIFGTPQLVQGTRTDIIKVKKMVLEGKPMWEIWQEVNSYQAVRMAELGMKYAPHSGIRNVRVIWMYGPTGSGKTMRAVSDFPNAWISSRNLKWWDGYEGQTEVIFDDFRGDFCTFHELLRLLDMYPVRVETKGSSQWLNAETIVITSCFHPRDVFKTREDVGQLLRRITHIFLCESIDQDPKPVGWEPEVGEGGSVAPPFVGTKVGGNTNH